MFSFSRGRHSSIVFDNGITVSISIGEGNYADNHHKEMDFSINEFKSKTAELGIYKNGKNITEKCPFSSCGELAYKNVNEVMQILNWAQNYKERR